MSLVPDAAIASVRPSGEKAALVSRSPGTGTGCPNGAGAEMSVMSQNWSESSLLPVTRVRPSGVIAIRYAYLVSSSRRPRGRIVSGSEASQSSTARSFPPVVSTVRPSGEICKLSIWPLGTTTRPRAIG